MQIAVSPNSVSGRVVATITFSSHAVTRSVFLVDPYFFPYKKRGGFIYIIQLKNNNIIK